MNEFECYKVFAVGHRIPWVQEELAQSLAVLDSHRRRADL